MKIEDILEPGDLIVIYWEDSVASVAEIGEGDTLAVVPRRTVGWVHTRQEDGAVTVLGDMFGLQGIEPFGETIGAEPRSIPIGCMTRVEICGTAQSYKIEVAAEPAKEKAAGPKKPRKHACTDRRG